MHRRFAVLRHYQTVPVIFVRNGERCFFQAVEQTFLGIAVVVKGLMVVDMIACEIREQCSVKVQACDALLCYGMAADFHERIFAPSIRHAAQQAVQFDGIRRGMGGRYRFVLDIIDHGG